VGDSKQYLCVECESLRKSREVLILHILVGRCTHLIHMTVRRLRGGENVKNDVNRDSMICIWKVFARFV
jgi:hypothetical protein